MKNSEATQFLEEAPCNVCNSSDAGILFSSRSGHKESEVYLPTTDSFSRYGRVVRCKGCGVARLSPRPTWDFLEKSYRESNDPLYLAEQSGRVGTAKRMLKVLSRYVSSGRLLDVGCGAGMLLSAGTSIWEPVGVELSRWAAQQARERFGLNVVEGTLKDASFPSGTFDAVTMIDVIEHLPNPRDVVEEVSRILRPNGAFFVLTPDIGAIVARLMGRWWWGLRPAHLYYFSRKTLASLLESSGFRVLSAGYYGRQFSFGYWVSRVGGYAPTLMSGLNRVSQLVGIGEIPIYLNTFDSIGILAVKKD